MDDLYVHGITAGYASHGVAHMSQEIVSRVMFLDSEACDPTPSAASGRDRIEKGGVKLAEIDPHLGRRSRLDEAGVRSELTVFAGEYPLRKRQGHLELFAAITALEEGQVLLDAWENLSFP